MDLTDNQNKPLVFALQLPSLKDLALMRIARVIWRSAEVIAEFHRVENIFEEPSRKHFRPLEKKSNSQVSRLPLPSLIAKDITPAVNFVGGVLRRWIDLFEKKDQYDRKFEEWPEKIYLDYIIRDKLRWTAYGTLDYLNTAKTLLRDETIPLEDRFGIACNFVSEEKIRRLWNELHVPLDITAVNALLLNNVVLLWTYTFSLRYWYKSVYGDKAVENLDFDYIPEVYFGSFTEFRHPNPWPKLSDEQKELYLVYFLEKARYSPLPNDKFYKINKMNFELQRKVLGSNAWWILEKLLSRPLQHLFFVTFIALRDHLDGHPSQVYDFLRTIRLNQCDDKFRDRLYAEVGPLIRNSCHSYPYPRRLASALVYQVWAGNVDFVREITSQLTTSVRLELILEALDHREQENVDGPCAVLESIKYMVEEWVPAEEWPDLKCRIRKELEENLLWVDFELQLENLLRSLDDFFGKVLMKFIYLNVWMKLLP